MCRVDQCGAHDEITIKILAPGRFDEQMIPTQTLENGKRAEWLKSLVQLSHCQNS